MTNRKKEKIFFEIVRSLLEENRKLKEKNEALMEELNNKINKDKLTGLYNREMSETAYQYCQFAIMCDIDDFKKLNDTYGHNFGDYVLIQISNILKKSIRKEDYVIRWGGEEFVIFIDNSNTQVIVNLANRIKTKIEMLEGLTLNNGIVCPKITMSFGISKLHSSKSENSLERDIEKADIALYESKNNGKNTITVYTKDLEPTLVK